MNRLICSKWMKILAGAVLLAVIAMLVLQRHQHTGEFNWRSKMWGDQAGYYVYAPAMLIYGFNSEALPESIVDKTGSGFTISENGKIITRYSYGVSLLQLPFFAVVHLWNGITKQEQDGFSGAYHLVSSLASIFYTFLGLIFLWKFLLARFRKSIALVTIASLYAGTNLFYYSIDATGMSHIYSFFLFALLLYLSGLYFRGGLLTIQTLRFAGIVSVSALIILIRPTNLAFIGLVFILDIRSWSGLADRFRTVFTLRNILIIILFFLIIFFPQFLYWKYSSGSFFTNPYQGYAFTNLFSPRLIEFLFSTNNGMFTYNPIYFLIFGALILMSFRKMHEGFYILGVTLALIYLFSSWFIFSFGCGFGSRNFVEYTAVFALPLGWLVDKIYSKVLFKKILFAVFVVVTLLINLQLTSVYNKCFLDGDWEWKEYAYMLRLRKYSKTHIYFPEVKLGQNNEYSKKHNVEINSHSRSNYRRALVTVNTEIYGESTEAMIVFTVVSDDSTLYWNGYPLKNKYDFDRGGIQRVTADFWLPRHYTIHSVASTFVWNINRDSLQLTSLKLKME